MPVPIIHTVLILNWQMCLISLSIATTLSMTYIYQHFANAYGTWKRTQHLNSNLNVTRYASASLFSCAIYASHYNYSMSILFFLLRLLCPYSPARSSPAPLLGSIRLYSSSEAKSKASTEQMKGHLLLAIHCRAGISRLSYSSARLARWLSSSVWNY